MLALNPSKAGNDQTQMNHFDDFRRACMNAALTSAGLAIGIDKTKVLIGNTVTYLVDGVFKSKTTAEQAFTATTHDITANASVIQERYYVLCLPASGTPAFVAGVQANTGEGKLPEWAAIIAAGTPIGYVKIEIAAGSTIFDATTDALDAAHITDTYVNWGGPIFPKFAAAL